MKKPAITAPVVCLGLSPACQRTLIFERFCAGEVNRAAESVLSTGGKAVNVAVALSRLGRACVVGGLNGGETGRLVSAYLMARGVTCAFTRTPWATRTCTTILDCLSGEVTELVEEARRPTPVMLRRFQTRGRACLRQAGAGVICGTLPAGVPENLWARFAMEAQQVQVPLMIDSSGAPLLRALRHAPLLAKMNMQELAMTYGVACRTEGRMVATARQLTAAGAHWALITRGPHAAILVGRAGEAWRILPPQIEVVSPIGSGDCVNAGLVHAVLNGAAMPEAVRMGLGCGCANAVTRLPADFQPAQARAFARACRVERISKSQS